MKISYRWLTNYIKLDLSIQEISEALTDIGLEVEGVEVIESVKGGLKGLVIGEVLSVKPHPNADKLSICKVNVNHAEQLNIVCGAPNVAAGQKVVVALVGTTLYSGDKEFKIGKSKIRGENSEGMICAEDEIGLGTGHDGIMVLDASAEIGQEAATYFNIEEDTVFEIGLTPNRIDAASHYGVARDLAVFLNMTDNYPLLLPSVEGFKQDENSMNLNVEVENLAACPRYSALCISDVKVGESPDWLKNRLTAIGLKPINNVVDATNFVLHEIGQPLHAFDASKIAGNKVIVKEVKEVKEGILFTTLDEVERKLSSEDLMICNASSPMCIAGVFGGKSSGVNKETTHIFLESAYFNSVNIRKTAKRHGLNTDASFRYERGADPAITVYALKRAALLIKELTGGKIASSITDIYPEPIQPDIVDFSFENCYRLIGDVIDKELIKKILTNLEIKILHADNDKLRLEIPLYRVDVKREVDVIEEILRIYGYNRIPDPEYFRTSLSFEQKPSPVKIENAIAEYLSNNGFNEIFTNSLTNPNHYQNKENFVEILNPLSKELQVMRKTLLFGGLESLSFNLNRKRKNLKFYEFGATYLKLNEGSYAESKNLALFITGNTSEETWESNSVKTSDYYTLKGYCESTLKRLGFKRWKIESLDEHSFFENGAAWKVGKTTVVEIGEVKAELLKNFGIKQAVYFAEYNWSAVLNCMPKESTSFKPIVKFPMVRRDLALLLDDAVGFDSIQALSKQKISKGLKSIDLFDVYEGKNLPAGKKSYGVSFHFQDESKTMTDQQVDQIMSRLITAFQEELGAELR